MKTKKNHFFPIIVSFFCIIFILSYSNKSMNSKSSINILTNKNPTYDKDELGKILQYIFNQRSSCFTNENLEMLPQYFDTSQKYGNWALEHEVKRIKYLKDWSYQRGIKFTNVESTINIKKISPSKNGVKVNLDEVYKFYYIYPKDENPITNSFGVSLNHFLILRKKDDNWVIYNDWYLDCFEDGLKAYSGNINNNNISPKPILNLGNCPNHNTPVKSGKYNRIKAAEYANKYCGVPWGSGNNFTHNKKYINYTGIGGDCTNFSSQILGDKEAGGLKSDGAWYYRGGSGSTAWVNADAFKNYLLYSGKGNLIKKGTFKEVTTPIPGYPCGFVQKLELGDVIGYTIKNDVDHFAVVTSFDSHGYPMINSHTVNRYHVPWDLGWGDNSISFYLIHIRD